MWLVVGLGNPGARYDDTRHNIGFRIVDDLLKEKGQGGFQSGFDGEVARVKISDETVVLLKPHTYMNLSGKSVQPAAHFFKVPIHQVLVVHDDLDLDFASLRFKEGGGHGGHNGLKDIAEKMGKDFLRLRFGIGRPMYKGTESAFVLHPFSDEEIEDVDKAAKFAVTAIEVLIEKGLAAAQRKFHKRNKPKPAETPTS